MTAHSELLSIVRAWCAQHPDYPSSPESIVGASDAETVRTVAVAIKAACTLGGPDHADASEHVIQLLLSIADDIGMVFVVHPDMSEEDTNA